MKFSRKYQGAHFILAMEFETSLKHGSWALIGVNTSKLKLETSTPKQQ